MKIVSGLFKTYQDADAAIRALYNSGYDEHDISVVGQAEVLSEHDETSHTAEDAGKGAGVGGLVGLVAGVVPFAIPGIGPIIGAGSLIGGALTGAGVGSAVGGIVGLFRTWFGEGDHVDDMKNALEQGHILVAVETSSALAAVAEQTLQNHGAYKVHEHVTKEDEVVA